MCGVNARIARWMEKNGMARRMAPARSPLPRMKFQRARNTAARIGMRSTRDSKILLASWPAPPESLAGIRAARVHGPIKEKKTGRPRQAAASTRRGRLLYPGHWPVHAWRTSDAASDVQTGADDWNLDISRPAAAKR